MKKLFIILLIFSSCKKNNNASSSSSASVSIQVNELTTGSPVSGATVVLQRCAAFGCVFGIVQEFSGVTDNNGIVKVPQDKYDKIPFWNEATFITKPNYWTETFTKATPLSLTPMGWMSLRIIKGTNYPAGSVLTITAWRQTDPPNIAHTGYISSRDFNAAADSIVLINGFGNQVNKITWQVTSGINTLNSGTWNQSFPRMDTVRNVTLNY